MAETDALIAPPNGPVLALPAEVVLHDADLQTFAFTPRQLDAVMAQFGRSYLAIISDLQSDDRFKVTAWLKLQEEMGQAFPFDSLQDVRIVVKTGERAEPDPTERGSSSS